MKTIQINIFVIASQVITSFAQDTQVVFNELPIAFLYCFHRVVVKNLVMTGKKFTFSQKQVVVMLITPN